jgi:hypothetical protein
MSFTKKDLLDLILLGFVNKTKTKTKSKIKPKILDLQTLKKKSKDNNNPDIEKFFTNEVIETVDNIIELKDDYENEYNDIIDDIFNVDKPLTKYEQKEKLDEIDELTKEFLTECNELIDEIFTITGTEDVNFTMTETEADLLRKYNIGKKKINKKIQPKTEEEKQNLDELLKVLVKPEDKGFDLDDFGEAKLLQKYNTGKKKISKKIQPKTEQEKQNLDELDDLLKLFVKPEDKGFDLDDFGLGKTNIIQSVLVPKSKFTKNEAIKYVKKHFKFKKLDENQRKNFYSFRQFNPTKGSNYSTKILKNGVELVLEYRRTTNPSREKNKGGSLPVKTIYKSIKNGYSYPEIEDLDGFVFNKYGSDKEIQLYVNEKEKRIIINFIGTYTLFDWSNNYSYVMGKYKKTKRFKRARDAFIKITDNYKDYKVILVGHSQSAVITNLLNQEFPHKIYEVINLNGANLGEKEKDNEYNIRSEMDLVSLLHKPTKRDVIINNDTYNIITEHKPDILKRLNQDREIGR